MYLNAVKLSPGEYSVDGRWIRVRRPIRPKRDLGFGRRLMLGMGIGVYGDLASDQVDISYQRGGRPHFETGVAVIPPTGGSDPS